MGMSGYHRKNITMMKKEWLTNCRKDKARQIISKLEGSIIEGDPKGMPQCTQSELKNMGMVGLYRLTEEDKVG